MIKCRTLTNLENVNGGKIKRNSECRVLNKWFASIFGCDYVEIKAKDNTKMITSVNNILEIIE